LRGPARLRGLPGCILLFRLIPRRSLPGEDCAALLVALYGSGARRAGLHLEAHTQSAFPMNKAVKVPDRLLSSFCAVQFDKCIAFFPVKFNRYDCAELRQQALDLISGNRKAQITDEYSPVFHGSSCWNVHD
jgi:hypothetical protein